MAPGDDCRRAPACHAGDLPSGKIRRGFARARELFPLTSLGAVLVALAGGTLAVFGYGELDLVLLVLSLFALVFAAVALLLVVGAALWLGLRRRRPREPRPAEIETGRWSPT